MNLGSVPALDIVLLANFTSDDASGNNRFNDLAGRLTRRGANVELVTSNFSHSRKLHRVWPFGEVKYKLTKLNELGYRKNVSPRRLLSQRMFAAQVASYLRKRTSVPDLIYCATPPPSVAAAAGKYGARAGVPVVTDIQDLWPDAFSMLDRFPRLIQLVFGGMRRAGGLAYEASTLVVGVSETFVESAQGLSPKKLSSRVVYLGTDLARFDQEAVLRESSPNADEELTVVYVGTLSISYDLRTVVEAIALASRRTGQVIKLLVLGDGPLRSTFQDYARQFDVAAEFTGRLPYAHMVRRLVGCDIAVNPIVAGSAGSVLNKVADYAAAGIPVVNTQLLPEYRALLQRYGAGINCAVANVECVAEAIVALSQDNELRIRMGARNRVMAEELFDRGRSYESLADFLVETALDRRSAG